MAVSVKTPNPLPELTSSSALMEALAEQCGESKTITRGGPSTEECKQLCSRILSPGGVVLPHCYMECSVSYSGHAPGTLWFAYFSLICFGVASTSADQ